MTAHDGYNEFHVKFYVFEWGIVLILFSASVIGTVLASMGDAFI